MIVSVRVGIYDERGRQKRTTPSDRDFTWIMLERIVQMMHFSIQPIVSILAGLLILAVPRALNYIVAVYLILIGIFGLMRF